MALSGYILSKEDKEYALLEGLGHEYEILKTVLQAEDTWTFEQKVSRLELREAELNAAMNSESLDLKRTGEGGSAFITPDTRKRDSYNRHIICFYCKKKGHPKRKCFFNPESPN